jgi:uroporphyrin-III C-methyltransferase / precorrin-2 dehydrogenase / sirohydrochlorin ferrochelatase
MGSISHALASAPPQTAHVTEPVYPLFLRLQGRLVVVVGAGEIAEKKIEKLIEAGARLRIVAPSISDAVRAFGQASGSELLARPFEETDLDGAWLVITSTDDPEANRRVSDACEERRLFCLAVDDLAHASCFAGAEIRREPFTVAISTGGAAPALARLVREIIELALPEADWVAEASALRDGWKRSATPMASRFPELVRAFAERVGYFGSPK